MCVNRFYHDFFALVCCDKWTNDPQVPSDVLTGFSSEAQFTVARALISTIVCFCYPLQAHPARASIINLLNRGGPNARALATSPCVHSAVTAMFLLASFGIASAVNDLGIVLSVVGATGCTTTTFILPGLCYYNLFPEPHLKRTLALCQFLLGCFIVPFALTFIAIDAFFE